MKFSTFNQLPLTTDDFFYRHFDSLLVNDAIVIHNPPDALVVSPVFLRSTKTLEEHIVEIQEKGVKKAHIIAEDISFLRRCPGLEYIEIYPAVTARNFDYSPLYDMPNLKWVVCGTTVGWKDEQVASVDYSRMKGIQHLVISHACGHQNVTQAGEVTSMIFQFGYPLSANLNNTLPGSSLRSLAVNQAPIQSLDGIDAAVKLKRLELSSCRRLTDISALRHLKETLAYLEIDTCGKIHDFSVFSELHNLEYLILKGSNTVPNLAFLRDMPKLKYLHFTMKVEDGDLTPCFALKYVRIQNRKHYSHKDADMPKAYLNPDEAYPFVVIE